MKQRSAVPVNECFDRISVSLDVFYVFNTFLIDDFSRLFYDVFTQKDFVIMIFSIPTGPLRTHDGQNQSSKIQNSRVNIHHSY